MAPSVLASSDRRWGENAALTRKPPERDVEHLRAVTDDDEGAHAGLQDAVQALTQGLTRGDGGQGRLELGCDGAPSVQSRAEGTACNRRRTGDRGARDGRRRRSREVVAARRDPQHLDGRVDLRCGPGHDGRREPQAGGLGQPPVHPADLTELTAQADLGAGHARGRVRGCPTGGGHRQADGQVGSGLHHLHPADGHGVHVVRRHGDAGPTFQDGQQQGHPPGVEALRRPAGLGQLAVGHQGLDLDQEWVGGPRARV